jgi:uncharacterized protein YqgV (UPF0045/DUF77 family)
MKKSQLKQLIKEVLSEVDTVNSMEPTRTKFWTVEMEFDELYEILKESHVLSWSHDQEWMKRSLIQKLREKGKLV